MRETEREMSIAYKSSICAMSEWRVAQAAAKKSIIHKITEAEFVQNTH